MRCQEMPLVRALVTASTIWRSGLVVVEPLGEFVGVVEDLLDGPGYQASRNSGRAAMAWTMNAIPSASTTPIPSMRAEGSGPMSMVRSSRSNTRLGCR